LSDNSRYRIARKGGNPLDHPLFAPARDSAAWPGPTSLIAMRMLDHHDLANAYLCRADPSDEYPVAGCERRPHAVPLDVYHDESTPDPDEPAHDQRDEHEDGRAGDPHRIPPQPVLIMASCSLPPGAGR